MNEDGNNHKKGGYYPTGLFACLSGLAGGVGLPWIMFKDGLPEGHGSGSEIANGFVIFLIPMFAVFGAFAGAIVGAVIGFIVHLVKRS